jgi:hypothetical protein
MGGAFLRHLWLLGVVGSLCWLRRGSPALDGAFLAVATLLRIFPAAFLWGLAATGAWSLAAARRWPSCLTRAFLGFAATAALLGAATLALPRGAAHWREFRTNMEHHLEHTAYNTIGLTEILAYRGPAKPTTPEDVADDRERRAWLRRAQLLVPLPIVLLGVALLARRQDEPAAMALGAALPLFVGLNLAAYYWMFLLALLLALRDRPRVVALMFAAEAASHTLLLFEDRQVAVYFYRNLVVLYLLAAVYLEGSSAQGRGVCPSRPTQNARRPAAATAHAPGDVQLRDDARGYAPRSSSERSEGPASGSSIVKCAPLPGSLLTEIVPP